MPFSSWFDSKPHLLEREQDALAAFAIDFSIDSTARDQGILKVNLTIDPANPHFAGIDAKWGKIDLVAEFPDNYPYFRPEVSANNVTLPRHQHPVLKNLCLLPRSTEHWEPEWTLAAYLKAQLGKVLTQGQVLDPTLLAADPHEQAEPVSNYMASASGPAIVFDPSDFEVDFSAATPEITLLGKLRIGLPKQAALITRMAVLEASKADGKAASKMPTSLRQLFPVECTGYVLQLSSPPPMSEVAQDLRWLKALIAKQPKVLSLGTKPVLVKDGHLTHVWALTFPEETEPGVLGQGWIFLVQGIQTVQVPQGKGKLGKQAQEVCYYAQAARNGTANMRVRVPALASLQQHKVAIAGLGAIGAPIAIELARNQVGTLHLLDYDIVDPGPSVRWPLGLPAFGQLKTAALAQFIEEHYPRTKVKVFPYRIGLPRSYQEAVGGEPQVMEKFMAGTSLLIDASVEMGVSHFLSTEARQQNLPYLCLYATPGAWGGLVMRVIPGRTTGCWMCLQYAKDDGSIPIPPGDFPHGNIQAPGCGDLTFTGAGFDLQNVSLTAVRLAVATLSNGVVGGYPDFDWDVGVLRLVDEQNAPILPSWQTYPLHAHPQCPYCTQ